MSRDSEQFVLLPHPASPDDIVLICKRCNDVIFGAPGDGIGKGDPEDSELDQLIYRADEHRTFVCLGSVDDVTE